MQNAEYIAIRKIPDELKRRGLPSKHTAIGFRWTSRGVGGTVLKSVKVGGQRFTRSDWLDDFIQQLSERRDSKNEVVADTNEATSRAIAELEFDGI